MRDEDRIRNPEVRTRRGVSPFWQSCRAWEGHKNTQLRTNPQLTWITRAYRVGIKKRPESMRAGVDDRHSQRDRAQRVLTADQDAARD